MTQKIKLMISQSTDAHFNLTIEEIIFNEMDPNTQVLFLWRNQEVIVIGRGQNPWKECHTAKMEQDGIMLARRQSGGGAVFHDLGNICFTFMAPKPQYNKEISTEIVLNALKSLGIDAYSSGRNDLVVDYLGTIRKISGSAYKEKADRGFHHGTIMLNLNIDKLTQYLNPDPKKIQAKGISSVRSRVTNLIDIKPELTYEQVFSALADSFSSYHQQSIHPQYLTSEEMRDFPGFMEKYAHQQSWAWNYGKVPEFTHQLENRFTWGGIDLLLTVCEGKIKDARIYTDCLMIEPLEQLAAALIQQTYQSQMTTDIIPVLIKKHPNFTVQFTELQTWLDHELK